MNDNECEYCQVPEHYGLLPAVDVVVPKWSANKGASGGGDIYRIYPPRSGVSGFVGVRCKEGVGREKV